MASGEQIQQQLQKPQKKAANKQNKQNSVIQAGAVCGIHHGDVKIVIEIFLRVAKPVLHI